MFHVEHSARVVKVIGPCRYFRRLGEGRVVGHRGPGRAKGTWQRGPSVGARGGAERQGRPEARQEGRGPRP